MPVSQTKREAWSKAVKLAQEGKDRAYIVSALVATYLYDTRTAYSLANAALLSVKEGVSPHTTPSWQELDRKGRADKEALNKEEFPDKEVIEEE